MRRFDFDLGYTTCSRTALVVTRDIPAGVLAVGNPCRVVRKIAGV